MHPIRHCWARWGSDVEVRGPEILVRVDRTQVASVLPELLEIPSIVDITVEDVPLEEIVASLFRSNDSGNSRTHDGAPV